MQVVTKPVLNPGFSIPELQALLEVNTVDVDPLSQPVRGVTLFYMHWCPLLAVQRDNLEMRQDMKEFMRDSAYIQCAPHILEDGVTCCLQPRVHGKLYSQSSMHNCRAVM